MNLLVPHRSLSKRVMPHSPDSKADRVIRVIILAAGGICFILLCWGHLGLGAWLFPPAPTAPQQSAAVGPYHVQFISASGRLTAGGPNAVAFVLLDQAQRPVNGATVRVQPVMTTMTMDVPAALGHATGSGRYIVHPIFGMAGVWRLNVTMLIPGQPERHATFTVSVRWS